MLSLASSRDSSRTTSRTTTLDFDAITGLPESGGPQFSGTQTQFPGSQLSGSQLSGSQFTSTRLFSGPQFSGTGTLLTDHCATAQYTLIDYGPTASYVPFIGCIDGQPECCPFTPVPPSAHTTPTVSVQGIPAAASPPVYPQPKNAKDAIVNTCPKDYSSVSGICCPTYVPPPSMLTRPLTLVVSAYSPWTAALGGITPCYSTLPVTTPPPPETKAIAVRETRPTVTVTGTVFAMPFAVLDDGALLSAGGIAGVVVGSSVFLGLIGWGIRWFRRRRRDARTLERLREELQGGYGNGQISSPEPLSLSDSSQIPHSLNNPTPLGFAANLGHAYRYAGRPRALDTIVELPASTQPAVELPASTPQAAEMQTTPIQKTSLSTGDEPRHIRIVPKPVQSHNTVITRPNNWQLPPPPPNLPFPPPTRRRTYSGHRPPPILIPRTPSAGSSNHSITKTPDRYYNRPAATSPALHHPTPWRPGPVNFNLHGNCPSNNSEEATPRVWQEMASRAGERPVFEVGIYRAAAVSGNGIAEGEAEAALERTRTILDRGRAAYRYRVEDLERGEI